MIYLTKEEANCIYNLLKNGEYEWDKNGWRGYTSFAEYAALIDERLKELDA